VRDVDVVWSADCLRHDPAAEIWVGVRTPATDVAERVERIRDALADAGARLLPVTDAGLAAADRLLGQVHDPGLVRHLRDVFAEWERAGMPRASGQERVVPYVFPTAGLLGDLPLREPIAVHARAGRWCYDTMTLVGPGTWEAARAAAGAAAQAASIAAEGSSSGPRRVVYALCRPPGHHVTRDAYGGSCYLNNAAVAAQGLREAGAERVAVLDLDAHHGNGTQAIFYGRGDVFYGSVHVDPGAGWFPHYAGFADETGTGAGAECTLNVPLAPGSGDGEWLDGVERLAEAAERFGADALVVSLGVDAAEGDPESPLEVSVGGYRAAGERLSALAASLPTVAVQEGGYDLATIGPLVVAALSGLASKR
jgi:acetoin utilization deacetylase AcuC-like enzyme